jgi:hypothetical protein
VENDQCNAAGTSDASAKLVFVGGRAILVALVAAAPPADAAGARSVAFWALVVAVPFGVACALDSFGTHLEERGNPVRSLQALLWVPALVLLLAAAAARGSAVAASGVPRLGVTALVGCIAVLALKAALRGLAALYRDAPAAVRA